MRTRGRKRVLVRNTTRRNQGDGREARNEDSLEKYSLVSVLIHLALRLLRGWKQTGWTSPLKCELSVKTTFPLFSVWKSKVTDPQWDDQPFVKLREKRKLRFKEFFSFLTCCFRQKDFPVSVPIWYVTQLNFFWFKRRVFCASLNREVQWLLLQAQ